MITLVLDPDPHYSFVKIVWNAHDAIVTWRVLHVLLVGVQVDEVDFALFFFDDSQLRKVFHFNVGYSTDNALKLTSPVLV